MQSEPQLQDAWANGSYADLATNYLSMAATLVDRTAVDSGDRVLDIGCGTGNVAITAARRGGDVTGVDITPELLAEARENADLAGFDGIDWREGDAADLPLQDDAFDVTLSCLGHMYGDPPEAVTRELLRVTRPGGRIGFVSWTPTGLFPFVAGVLTTYLPQGAQPDYAEPPFMWGDSDIVRSRLGDRVENLTFRTETATYPTLSPAHFWQELATTSGVFGTFLETVPEDDRPTLRSELVETIETYFEPGENAVTLEYLLTMATVRK